MSRLFFLGLAGAAGTVSRYLLDGWVYTLTTTSFPYGTLAINVLGCFAIGFIGTLADERLLFRPEWRSVIILGFLGAFTTFSSFTYETWAMVKDGEWYLAGMNAIGMLVACFVSLLVGVVVARFL